MEENIELLRYPIGKFQFKPAVTPEDRKQWIAVLADFPLQLRNTVIELTDEQLDTSYRPGGWTIRQVIHHVADSHLNAYIRFKLALTEDNPTVRPYDENLWAALGDAKYSPIEASLQIIEGLHKRFVQALNEMEETQFKRTYFHPQSRKTFTLEFLVALYSWHSTHHLSHISSTINRSGW